MATRFRSKCNVYRYLEEVDEIGGITKTEQMVYKNIPIQLSANMPNMQLQQQGIETRAIFSATMRSRYRRQPVDIREEDEIELVDGYFLSGVFRVTGVQVPVIRNGTSIHLTLQQTRVARRKSF